MQYLIIGDGRLARHFCHYLTQLNLSYTQWSRKANKDLTPLLESATHVLLLIKDSAIETFIQTYLTPKKPKQTLIHCSGCLATSLAYSAHPLQTFSLDLYGDQDYQKIPFIIEAEGPSFADLLPGLPNPNYAIPRADKAAYHAYCVMSNNFMTLLWQKFTATLQNRWQIDESHLKPFLQKTLENLSNSPHTALTGPIARNDKSTIDNHLNALENDHYQTIYKAFLEVYCEKEEK